MVCGCGADAGEDHQVGEADQRISAAHTMAIGISAPSDSTADPSAAPISVFTIMPPTVRLVADCGYLTVNMAGTAQSGEVVELPTNGKSLCITVSAHSPDVRTAIPLELGFTLEGDVDPCSGERVTGPILDFTVKQDPVAIRSHEFLRQVCDNGVCHSVLVTAAVD
jgi:hypothetical protein